MNCSFFCQEGGEGQPDVLPAHHQVSHRQRGQDGPRTSASRGMVMGDFKVHGALYHKRTFNLF